MLEPVLELELEMVLEMVPALMPERASAPSEPKRGRKSSRWNVAISDRLDSDRGEYRRPAPYHGLGQDYGRQAGTTYFPVSLEMTSPSWR